MAEVRTPGILWLLVFANQSRVGEGEQPYMYQVFGYPDRRKVLICCRDRGHTWEISHRDDENWTGEHSSPEAALAILQEEFDAE